MTIETKTGTEITQPGTQDQSQQNNDKQTNETKTAEQLAAEQKAAEEKAASDKKAADDKAAADKKAADEKAAKESSQKKAPEKYELKLPEGSKLDAKHLEKIAAFAKERGLSNEDAQAMLDRDSQLLADFQQTQETQLKETTDKWLTDSKEDKEIGGESFAQSAELSKRVVQTFGTEAFQKALESSGFGNHPELVRVFYRIGKAMKEDQLVTAGGQTSQKKDVADLLYGGSSKNNNQ